MGETRAATSRHSDERPQNFDVIAMGRTCVDIYPLQRGVPLERVQTFGKFLGGSATNVAVAAARLGNRSAPISAVGDDPFGRFAIEEIAALGANPKFVVTVPQFQTPVTFCEIFPPNHFPLYFYRSPSAPDLRLTRDDVPLAAVTAARVFWMTATGLSGEPSRNAHLAALEARRGAGGWNVLDLDYRPALWKSPRHAADKIADVLPLVNVVVGNRSECEVATGIADPDGAADALLELGVELAIVKQGSFGALAKTRDEREFTTAIPVDVHNGLGAGDAFGGALCHGLLRSWKLDRTMRFASAAGAYVASKLECSAAMPTQQQVLELLNKQEST